MLQIPDSFYQLLVKRAKQSNFSRNEAKLKIIKDGIAIIESTSNCKEDPS